MANYQSAYSGADIDTAVSKMHNLLEYVYPVGSIYMSVNSTNPETIFGGTWARITDCFLLASGNIYAPGTTGGEANHTLSVNEIPAHGHPVFVWDSAGTMGNAYYYNGTSQVTHSGARLYSSSASSWIAGGSTANAAGSGLGDPSGTTNISGGNGGAHNNMPPYLAVYVWQRTA